MKTASYKNKNLSGVRFWSNNLTDWSFADQNLTNADFQSANLTNADLRRANLTGANLGYAALTNADLRGADLDSITGTPTMKNTIWNDGVIRNFSMASGADSFAVGKYEGLAPISAKLNAGASISNGAVLSIAAGEVLEIANNSILTLASGGGLVLEADGGGNASILVEPGSGLAFGEGSTLTINLSSEFPTPQTFAAMSWTDLSKISGTENLVKNESVFVNFADPSQKVAWSFSIKENGLYFNVPEPATHAAIFGALALVFAAWRRRSRN